MRTRRIAATVAAAVLTASGLAIAGAAPASANQVWHQSVGRASADAPCPDSDPALLALGWSKWAPSYEQWPNNGQGGWTCTRSITWAKSTPPGLTVGGEANPSLCVEVFRFDAENAQYLDFALSRALPSGSPIYTDRFCTSDTEPTGYDFVLVPTGGDPDLACRDGFGAEYVSGRDEDWQSNIYDCRLSD